jgi:hypothetical protein
MRKIQLYHHEELHTLYSSPNILRQIKSRRMSWAGHVARMEECSVQGIGGKPEGKNHSEDRGVDRRMGSEWTLRILDG